MLFPPGYLFDVTSAFHDETAGAGVKARLWGEKCLQRKVSWVSPSLAIHHSPGCLLSLARIGATPKSSPCSGLSFSLRDPQSQLLLWLCIPPYGGRRAKSLLGGVSHVSEELASLKEIFLTRKWAVLGSAPCPGERSLQKPRKGTKEARGLRTVSLWYVPQIPLAQPSCCFSFD